VVQGIARSVTREVDAQVQANQADPEAVQKGLAEVQKRFISTFFADDEAMAEALMVIPLVLLVVFKTGLRFLPLFAGVMGFDQVSGEVGPRSIRYLAVRSRRSSVLIGKFLAQATLLAALMLIIDTGLCLYVRFTQPDISTQQMLLTLGRFWASAVVFSLAYLALTSLCSTLFRQPAVSLVTNVIALFAIWLLAFVGGFFRLPGADDSIGLGAQVTSPLAYLRYASVWHYSSDLLHPKLPQFGVAVFAHLGFTALFLGCAYLVLRRRDL
jgi:ABC-2 type transport system permease protein